MPNREPLPDFELPDHTWQSEGVPLKIALRGLLPKWLGGEMPYEAIARKNPFSTHLLRMEYLFDQRSVAECWLRMGHAEAISAHIKRLSESFDFGDTPDTTED